MADKMDDKSYDQSLASDVTELVAEITAAVRDQATSVFDILGDSYKEKLETVQIQVEKRRQDSLIDFQNKLADYEAKGFIKRYSAEDKIAAKRENNAGKIREIEEQERKLKNIAVIQENNLKSAAIKEELEAYTAMSDLSKQQSQLQLSILEKQREAEQARAEGNEKEAKIADKKAAELKKQLKEAEKRQQIKEANRDYDMGENLSNRYFANFKEALRDDRHVEKTTEENLSKAIENMSNNIKQLGNAINNAISSYAKFQTGINARLQGVSSFSEATQVLSKIAFSPLLNAEELYGNLAALVDRGIVTNVEQRAMFETVKDGIAKTFDVTDASMLRMIRLQRNDITAARLGLEAYLNRFLNVYVENTEYLTSTFDNVASSLFEASALLSRANNTQASLEFEYIVQKWLGTLTGLGLSDNAATSIANAIGQLGSGEVDNSMESLIVMAASRANLSYAEMLHQGVTANEANVLLKSIVQYLQELAGYDSNIVKNQLSKIFGVTVSDLVAVTNLTEASIKEIENDILTYDQMYGELEYQFKQLPSRLGIANLLENAFSNLTYQTGMSIGANPVSFATWKIADLVHNATGGINIPFITALGSGIGLEATVERLIQLGIVGITTLGNIGNIISGVSSAFDGSTLLESIGVGQSTAQLKTLGGGGLQKSASGRTKGSTLSQTAYVGNTDSTTYSESAINQAKEGPKQELNQQKEEEYKNDPVVKYLKNDAELEKWKDMLLSMASITTLTNASVGMIQIDVGLVKTSLDDIKDNISNMLGAEGILAKIQADTALIAQNTSADSESSPFGALASGLSILTDSKNRKLTSKDISELSKITEVPIKELRAQQLAIYQSQVLNSLYTLDSSSSISEINSQITVNKANLERIKNAAVSGNISSTSDNIISPNAGGEFASLSDYLLQIKFAERMSDIDDNVKLIADAVTGSSVNSSEDMQGFTNLMF